MFRHQAFYSTIAYYIGMLSLVYLCFISGTALAYLPYIVILYLIGSITISVGYHRLFCHAAFETPKIVHWFFALSGVLFQYSSPLQWAVTHATHHKESDTDKDPHPTKMRAMLFKGYRDVPLDTLKARRLVRQQKLHSFIDKYYMAIYAVLLSILIIISTNFVLYIYLPTLGLAHFVGALHNTFSHWNNKPRDLAFMEYVLPASGEWLHGFHHSYPRKASFRSKWWHFDLGAAVVKLISTKKYPA
jgi:stearoyl-CoA desaturase (delta-9 desaturase)